MAESFLLKTDSTLEVFSGGLHPDNSIDPIAVQVMKEIEIEISTRKPKSHHEFKGMEFDYLITLCDATKKQIDNTNIPSKHHIHLGFEDPRRAYCTVEQIIYLYRAIRYEIKNELDYFYNILLINRLIDSQLPPL